MSTAVTMAWRVVFVKRSLTDDKIYYIDFAANLGRQVAEDVAKELKKLGYVNISTTLRITFPP